MAAHHTSSTPHRTVSDGAVMPAVAAHSHTATPAPKALMPLTMFLPFGTPHSSDIPISAVRMSHPPRTAIEE